VGSAAVTADFSRTTDDVSLIASATAAVAPDEVVDPPRFVGHSVDLSQKRLREYQKRYERELRDMSTMVQIVACLIAEIDS
jgi:hypothetical protein